LKNKAGKSGLQFALKYLPTPTLKSLEKRFNDSITCTTSETELDFEVKRKYRRIVGEP